MGKRVVYSIGILLLCIILGRGFYRSDQELSMDGRDQAKDYIKAVINNKDAEEQTVTQQEDLGSENIISHTQQVMEQNNIDSLEVSRLMEENVENIINSPAGVFVDITLLDQQLLESLFVINEITDSIKERIVGKSYGPECTIPFSDLRYLRVLHTGFDGKTYIGELIVNQLIAEDILEIMKELYTNDYAIELMVLVDEFDAEDIASMEANNSSAFNYRNIDGTSKLSTHSYGMAIDINPFYNPYVRIINGQTVVLPEGGSDHINREVEHPYYIKKGDLCYQAFVSRGFTWGGDWKNSKDYQHFQKAIEE